MEVPHRILACGSQAADFIGFLGGNELGVMVTATVTGENASQIQ